MTKYLVTDADRQSAAQLTERIRKATDNLWGLLYEAWETKAWASLGYRNWTLYCAGEFSYSQSRAYQLITQMSVTKALKEAAADSNTLENAQIYISPRDAANAHNRLPDVAADVREQVSTGVAPQEAIRVAVERVRPVTHAPFVEAHIEDDDEGATCVHEYVCRFCGELLQ